MKQSLNQLLNFLKKSYVDIWLFQRQLFIHLWEYMTTPKATKAHTWKFYIRVETPWNSAIGTKPHIEIIDVEAPDYETARFAALHNTYEKLERQTKYKIYHTELLEKNSDYKKSEKDFQKENDVR